MSRGTFCSQIWGMGFTCYQTKKYSSRNILTGRDVGDGGVLVEGDVVISGWVRVGYGAESHVAFRFLVDCC